MSPIELKNVSFSYAKKEQALENVTLEITEGDFSIILGPNGGGKSTLIKLIIGLLQPNKGEVRLFGDKPKRCLKKVGYLPQHIDVNPDFPVSVLDVVLMGQDREKSRRFFKDDTAQIQALESLEQVNMRHLQNRRIGSLSGGERQRVLIARALMTKPSLLLLDEPTASIDAAGKGLLYELLQNLNRSMTIVMVSHDLSVIPSGVKSVACVNRTLHYHAAPRITEEMLTMTYGCTSKGTCPVELVAHGIPHRVLDPHTEK